MFHGDKGSCSPRSFSTNEIDDVMRTVRWLIAQPLDDPRRDYSQYGVFSNVLTHVIARVGSNDLTIKVLADIWRAIIVPQVAYPTNNIFLPDVFLHFLIKERRRIYFVLMLLKLPDLLTFKVYLSAIVNGKTLFEEKITPLLSEVDFAILESIDPALLKYLILYNHDVSIVQKAVAYDRHKMLIILWNNLVTSDDDNLLQRKEAFVSVLLTANAQRTSGLINTLLTIPSFKQFFFSNERQHHVSCLTVDYLAISLNEKVQLLASDWNSLETESAALDFARQLFDSCNLEQHLEIIVALMNLHPTVTSFLSSDAFLRSAVVAEYLSFSFEHDKKNIARSIQFIDAYLVLFPQPNVRQYPLVNFYINEGIPFVMERCILEKKSLQPFLRLLKKLDPYLIFFSNDRWSINPRAVLTSIERHLMPQSGGVIKSTVRASLLNQLARNSELCWLLLCYAYWVPAAVVENVSKDFGFLVKLYSLTSSLSRFEYFVEYIFERYPAAQYSLIGLLRDVSIQKVEELNADRVQDGWLNRIFSSVGLSHTFFGFVPTEKPTYCQLKTSSSDVEKPNRYFFPNPFTPPPIPIMGDFERVDIHFSGQPVKLS